MKKASGCLSAAVLARRLNLPAAVVISYSGLLDSLSCTQYCTAHPWSRPRRAHIDRIVWVPTPRCVVTRVGRGLKNLRARNDVE